MITNSFKKKLEKLKIEEEIIIKEISKYKKGISYIDLGEWKGFCIYKDYLDSKKKRLITLTKVGKYYFPITILKKETKLGKNIFKSNIIDNFENDFYKVIKDFEDDQIYRIVEL